MLQMLARHPATARHVATKLTRHFVADDPPLVLVDKLTKRFLDTEGNLKEMAKALVAAPESWTSPRKLKRPGEWMIGMLRATNSDMPDVKPILRAAAALFHRHQQARNDLKEAEARLQERAVIDKAKALLIKNRRLSEPDAYKWLRRSAMSSARRIVDVANELIKTEGNAR